MYTSSERTRRSGVTSSKWSMLDSFGPSPEGERPDSAYAASAQRLQITAEITVSLRSEEHTSELQSLMRISYAVFCLKKKKTKNKYLSKSNQIYRSIIKI